MEMELKMERMRAKSHTNTKNGVKANE